LSVLEHLDQPIFSKDTGDETCSPLLKSIACLAARQATCGPNEINTAILALSRRSHYCRREPFNFAHGKNATKMQLLEEPDQWQPGRHQVL